MFFRLVVLLVLTAHVALAQTASNANWARVGETSNAVIVGTVEDISLVLNPDKEISTMKTRRDGTTVIEFQNPADYILGRVVRIRVNEIVKPDGTIKIGGTINLFLAGSSLTDQPVLAKNQKYLLFLSLLKLSNELRKAQVYPSKQPSTRTPFPSRVYEITADNAALLVNPSTQPTVNAAKKAVRSH